MGCCRSGCCNHTPDYPRQAAALRAVTAWMGMWLASRTDTSSPGRVRALPRLVGNTLAQAKASHRQRPTASTPVSGPASSGPASSAPAAGSPGEQLRPVLPRVCLHDGIGDYDCAGGSGNGPNYVDGPIKVLPPDPFDLDRDGDGTGCE